jgi:hypothetical protein
MPIVAEIVGREIGASETGVAGTTTNGSGGDEPWRRSHTVGSRRRQINVEDREV